MRFGPKWSSLRGEVRVRERRDCHRLVGPRVGIRGQRMGQNGVTTVMAVLERRGLEVMT